MIVALICFLMALVNVPFILNGGDLVPVNLASFGFCMGVAGWCLGLGAARY